MSIKQQLSTLKGWNVDHQKLIFAGKVLSNEQTIENAKIKPKDFLVSMVSKPKKVSSSKPEANSSTEHAPTTNETPVPTSTETPAIETTPNTLALSDPPAPASNAPTSNAPASNAPTSDAQLASTTTTSEPIALPSETNTLLSGETLRLAKSQMIEMGFDSVQVDRAMRASFNNPDRAVEYLFNGIPEGILPDPLGTSTPIPPDLGSVGSGTGTVSGTGVNTGASTGVNTGVNSNPGESTALPSGTIPDAPLRSNLFEAAAAIRNGETTETSGRTGQFGGQLNRDGTEVLDLSNPTVLDQLRVLAEQNPTALEPLIQAVRAQHATLGEALASNPAQVLRLLAQVSRSPSNSHASQSRASRSSSAEGQTEEGAEGEGEGDERASENVSLTSADRANLSTMIEMGVPATVALEVYVACGKQVELAVSYYFEHPEDFE